MTKFIPSLAAAFVLTTSTGALAQQCPDPNSENADAIVAERAYDLQDNGKTYTITAGGSANISHCGSSDSGFLPVQATIRLDLQAAEGKEAMIVAQSACGETTLFVTTPDFRGFASGDTSAKLVSVHVPRSEIGNDKTIMIFVGSANEGESCAGTVTIMTARG
jgi:hypothetical protein